MTTEPRARSLIVWGVAASVILSVQYLTISNVNLSPVGADTAPYRGPVAWLASRIAFITLQPMLPVMVHASRTLGSRWTGNVCRAIFRFKSPTANFVSFAVVNTAIWLVTAVVLLRLYRWVRRYRHARRA